MLIDDNPDQVHSRILDIASRISSPLFDAIKAIGPVSFPERENTAFSHFLSRAIVGQQLSTKVARSIWAKVEAAASSAESGIPTFFDDDCQDALRACGVSRNKIKALRSLCAAEREGLFCSQDLRNLTHETRSQRLLSIWGIGQWTCDMASIFYFRCPDIWPQGDVTVQRVFTRLIGRRKPVRAASYFAPYRSYLALAMWEITDALLQR